MAQNKAVRMCMVCRQMFLKKDLIRVVKNNLNEVSIDETGKTNGRGAYVCKNKVCINKCNKTKILNKTFEMPIPDEIYKALLELVISE